MKRLLPALLACALLPGSASGRAGGGTIWAFVSVSDGNRLAVVNVDGERVVGTIRLPRGSREIAATIDGHRVLAVSASSRTVTEADGVSRAVTRVFRGFGRPAVVVLADDPRYAYLADEARGLLDVLDLARGGVSRRLHVGPRPTRLALGNGRLWVAHARSGELTVVDVSNAARPRVVDHADAGRPVSDLATTEGGLSIVVAFRDSPLLGRIEAVSARLVERRSIGTIVGRIALDPLRRLWAVPPRGGRATVLSQRLRRLGYAAVPGNPTALVAVGGFMALAARGRLVLIAVGTPSRRTIPVGRGTGGVAFAIR